MEIIKAQATLTARYQTTVPTAIRKVLDLGANDKVEYTVDEFGRVIISKSFEDAPIEQFDPAVSAFLNFLGSEIEKNPGRLQVLTPAISERIFGRVRNLPMNFELDEPLGADEF